MGMIMKNKVCYSGGTYGGSSDSGINYSTDEQVIGTWIDGSALYEKTFTFDSTDLQAESSGKYIIFNIPNINKICEYTVTIEDGVVAIPYYINSSTYITAFWTVANNSVTGHFRYGSDVSSDLSTYFANSRITIRYIKSTP